jgi:hypothetical protein
MKGLLLFATLIVAVVAAWLLTAPPSYYEPAPAREVGAVPAALLQADRGDVLADAMETIARSVPGHDEVLPLPGTAKVLVNARDEWIWLVDTESGQAKQLAFSPVSPTGARMVPGRDDQAYVCMARLDYHQYEHSPGLYRLDINDGSFTPVATRVPITGHMRDDGLELPNANADEPDAEVVHTAPYRDMALSEMTEANSRPMQFCNDLDVTADGRYVYVTEPFSNPKASSGLGALPEAVTLARNGRVWRYDTQSDSIGLVLENVVFADGILIEYDDERQVQSLLITETVNFRIGRAWLRGPDAGSYQMLWDNLPGLPDGMDRDAEGRVWVALIKDRSPLVSWLHENPWIKPLVLRIPARWLTTSGATAIMVLSPEADEILAYTRHNGDRVRDLSVVVPIGDGIYLSSFYSENRGVHFVPVDAIMDRAAE